MNQPRKISFQFVCTTYQASQIVCDGLLSIFYSSLININICSIGTFISSFCQNNTLVQFTMIGKGGEEGRQLVLEEYNKCIVKNPSRISIVEEPL